MSSDINMLNVVKSYFVFVSVENDSPEYERNVWAYDLVCDYAVTNPEALWSFIREACSHEISETQLGRLAAGPLEDLIYSHGSKFINAVEEFASKNDKFVEALNLVYPSVELSDEAVWQRIKAIQSSE